MAAGARGARARTVATGARRAGTRRARNAPRRAGAAGERLSSDRSGRGRCIPGGRAERRSHRARGRDRPLATLCVRAGGARMTREPAKSRPASLHVRELESLRAELERRVGEFSPPRWNADPEDVQRSVARLVLTLVEFLRQLLERQAIRRMEAGTLTPEETEEVGRALMRLEETIRDIGTRFGLAPEELNLDLGPLGRLI